MSLVVALHFRVLDLYLSGHVPVAYMQPLWDGCKPRGWSHSLQLNLQSLWFPLDQDLLLLTQHLTLFTHIAIKQVHILLLQTHYRTLCISTTSVSTGVKLILQP